jgi:hypothetical protein
MSASRDEVAALIQWLGQDSNLKRRQFIYHQAQKEAMYKAIGTASERLSPRYWHEHLRKLAAFISGLVVSS